MGTTTSQEAWSALGSKLEALGLKLKLHYQQEAGEADEAAAGIKESLERVGDALEGAFDALGSMVEDDALRADTKDAGRLLLDAVNATFTDVGEELRDKVRRR